MDISELSKASRKILDRLKVATKEEFLAYIGGNLDLIAKIPGAGMDRVMELHQWLGRPMTDTDSLSTRARNVLKVAGIKSRKAAAEAFQSGKLNRRTRNMGAQTWIELHVWSGVFPTPYELDEVQKHRKRLAKMLAGEGVEGRVVARVFGVPDYYLEKLLGD